MIRIEQLKKAFRDGERTHAVLQGLDLKVEPGEFLAMVGRSGSGKSTLLNCIAGIERPDSGHIYVGETELSGLDDRTLTRLRRDRIGIIFQFFNLLPTLPVLENVCLPALLGGEKRKQVQARALALLEELELADRAHERPDHLSGGEQQRVATARALINDPVVLLADEPTGNLDAATGQRTLELLSDVNERHGVTVIMVTHSREAASVAQRVVQLGEGKIEGEILTKDNEEEAVVDQVLREESPSDTEEAAAKPAPQSDGETPRSRPSARAAALFTKGKAKDEAEEEQVAPEAETAETDTAEAAPEPEATPEPTPEPAPETAAESSPEPTENAEVPTPDDAEKPADA